MKSNEVQEELSSAIQIITSEKNMRVELIAVLAVLTTTKELAISRNEIPGLRGMGLTEVLELAHEINTNGVHGLRVDTKAFVKSISFAAN